MARITDINKVDRLKKATMKLVVERGFGGASAVLIAKEAKVATGYFYLHYKGKYEMVNTIFQEVFGEVYSIFEDNSNKDIPFDEIIETMNHGFVGMANNSPIKIKFLSVLTNDYSFVIDTKIKDALNIGINKLKTIGHNCNFLDVNITEDDLFQILFINSIQYVNHIFRNRKGKLRITSEEEKHLLYLTNKFIK